MALIVDEILTSLGTRIVAQLKNDVENKPVTKYGAVNASGALRDSIRFEVSNGVLKVFALDYAYYLERGRDKNKNQDKLAIKKWVGWAGNTFIKDWVEAKNISANPFAIAHKIATKGTTIFEQGGSDLFSGIINEQLINGLKSELFEAIINESVSQIKSDVLKLAA